MAGLLTLYVLILALDNHLAAGLSEETAANLRIDYYSASLSFPPVKPPDQKKAERPRLHLRIQEILVKKAGFENLEKLEPELKPLLNSEVLDLYLLYYWLRGQVVEGLCLSRMQLRQSPADPIL